MTNVVSQAKVLVEHVPMSGNDVLDRAQSLCIGAAFEQSEQETSTRDGIRQEA